MSMKLAILGLLMEGDSHTYEILQKMKERAMHNFIKIQDGSLYYAMDQLNKAGYVEAIEVINDSNRPDRTVYSISEAGKLKFQELLFMQMELPDLFFPPLSIALVFAMHADEDKMAAILQKKIEQCEKSIKKFKEIYEEHISEVPRVVLHMMYGSYEHMETELKWLKRLHQDAAAHRLKDVGTPLDLKP
jgi:DNA-binding PadR family transcriptional regulator